MTSDGAKLPELPRPARKLSPLQLGLGCSLVFVLVGMALWLWPMYVFFFGAPQRSFDQADWMQSRDSSFKDSARLRMVDDLMSKHTLVGRDQASIVSLLGPPDSKPYLLVEQPRHEGAFIYKLGPDHLGLDSMWLVIRWDANGQASAAEIVSD